MKSAPRRRANRTGLFAYDLSLWASLRWVSARDHSGGRIGAAIIVPGFLYIQTTWGVPAVFGTIAVMLAVAAFAVTQIGSETRGLALDAIAPPTG